MDFEKRAKKDIEKLENFIEYSRSLNFHKKYPKLFEHILNYKKDSEHYYFKKDYFSSLGCANYAYGILEGLLFNEKGKYFHEII
ncbi:MAG: DUF357 domain-containing protein [Candidatus Micrarchaeia archaeon]|jgi:hypothetical protein